MDLGIVPATETGRTAVADGRALAWAAWGPDDGQPVLFFPGAATSCSLGFGAHCLDALGVRLIALDRPGIGGSDPHPDRTLSTWADDVRAFVAEAQPEAPVCIVGYSMGSPYAFACAAAGVADAVSIVAGQDDVSHPATAALLEPGFSQLVQAVAADPTGVEASFASSANADMMMQLVMDSSSPHDLTIYGDDSFAPAYRAALEEGFRQGAAEYARDFVLAVGPWPFDVNAISVPVDLWYGELDASAVHSPDRGELLSTRIPTARRHVVADAGGSILWTHAEPILRALLDAH